MWWNELSSLLRESVLVQALLTLITGTAVVYLYVTHQIVPGELLDLLQFLLGLWVGGKLAMAQRRLPRKR